MAGSLPSSGAITLNMLNTYSGLASGTQVSMNSSLARLYAGKPTSGTMISMNDMRGNGVDYTLSLASPIGNGVYTPSLLLSTYFSSGQLPTGNRFYVTALCSDVYWPPDETNPTVTFIKGTADRYVYSRSYRKSYNMQIIYDGANTVYGYGSYSGDSTNYPDGKVTLTRIRLIL